MSKGIHITFFLGNLRLKECPSDFYSFAGKYLLIQRLVTSSDQENGSNQRNSVKHLKLLPKMVEMIYITEV
jgi:hypothetical protein